MPTIMSCDTGTDGAKCGVVINGDHLVFGGLIVCPRCARAILTTLTSIEWSAIRDRQDNIDATEEKKRVEEENARDLESKAKREEQEARLAKIRIERTTRAKGLREQVGKTKSKLQLLIAEREAKKVEADKKTEAEKEA